MIPPRSILLPIAIGLGLTLACAPAQGADVPSATNPGAGSETVTTKAMPSNLATVAGWQHTDGSWSEDDSGHGVADEQAHQSLCTGLGVLTFLGAGYDQVTKNAYRRSVQLGLNWICSHQRADGSFPGPLIDNAIQSMALSEALALTDDPSIRDAAYRGIQALLARRVMSPAPLKVRAWPDPDGRISTSANTWCIMAVKSALGAQLLRDREALAESSAWLAATWLAANPQTTGPGARAKPCAASMDFSHAPAIATGSDLYGGLAAAVFLSKGKTEPIVASLLPQLLSETADATSHLDASERLMRTYAMFEFGDREAFLAWKAACKQTLAAQRQTSGPLEGGWNVPTPAGTPGLGATASSLLSVLTIEVFYRYDIISRLR